MQLNQTKNKFCLVALNHPSIPRAFTRTRRKNLPMIFAHTPSPPATPTWPRRAQHIYTYARHGNPFGKSLEILLFSCSLPRAIARFLATSFLLGQKRKSVQRLQLLEREVGERGVDCFGGKRRHFAPFCLGDFGSSLGSGIKRRGSGHLVSLKRSKRIGAGRGCFDGGGGCEVRVRLFVCGKGA